MRTPSRQRWPPPGPALVRIVARRIRPDGRVGEERANGRAHDVGHADDPGPALERGRGLGDQHLGAVRGPQPARCRQRRAAASPPGRRRGRTRSHRVGAGRRGSSCQGSTIPTVVALTARSAEASALRRRRIIQAGRTTRSRRRPPPFGRRVPGGLRCPVPDHHAPRPGGQTGVDDRVGGSTRSGDDDRRARQRPAHRPLDARPEPRRVGVDADKRPSSGRTTLLTAPIRAASGSTSSTRPATTFLYGAVTPSPNQSGPRAAVTAARPRRARAPAARSGHRSRPRRTPRRAPTTECRRLSGLPSSATPGHDTVAATATFQFGRRTGPAVAGNVTFGMISSTHCWSWPDPGSSCAG